MKKEEKIIKIATKLWLINSSFSVLGAVLTITKPTPPIEYAYIKVLLSGSSALALSTIYLDDVRNWFEGLKGKNKELKVKEVTNYNKLSKIKNVSSKLWAFNSALNLIGGIVSSFNIETEFKYILYKFALSGSALLVSMRHHKDSNGSLSNKKSKKL